MRGESNVLSEVQIPPPPDSGLLFSSQIYSVMADTEERTIAAAAVGASSSVDQAPSNTATDQVTNNSAPTNPSDDTDVNPSVTAEKAASSSKTAHTGRVAPTSTPSSTAGEASAGTNAGVDGAEARSETNQTTAEATAAEDPQDQTLSCPGKFRNPHKRFPCPRS